jgi:hypothetical protein
MRLHFVAFVLLTLPCAALAVATVAAAQDRPVLAPTRDATIDYKVEGRSGNGPKTLRMMFTAGGKQMRIDMPEHPGYVVMDRAGGRMMIVMAQAQRYIERPMPPGQQGAFEMKEGQSFTRKGTETIAGYKCTVWESKGERSGSGCVTDDGLVLRGESATPDGQQSRLIATAVSIAPVNPDMFLPPAGFAKMEIPAMPPGGRPGAPRP